MRGQGQNLKDLLFHFCFFIFGSASVPQVLMFPVSTYYRRFQIVLLFYILGSCFCMMKGNYLDVKISVSSIDIVFQVYGFFLLLVSGSLYSLVWCNQGRYFFVVIVQCHCHQGVTGCDRHSVWLFITRLISCPLSSFIFHCLLSHTLLLWTRLRNLLNALKALFCANGMQILFCECCSIA